MLPVDFMLPVAANEARKPTGDTVWGESGLTRYLVHWDKVSVLLFDFGSVPGDEVNSQERQQTAGPEF